MNEQRSSSPITRRHFLVWTGGALAGSRFDPSFSNSPKQPTTGRLRGTIDVDLNTVIGKVSPYIFGQFIEHIHRAIDGSIFAEGSPLSTPEGYRKDVLQRMQRLRPTVLRYPGGTFSKIYHWEQGVGPLQARPARPNRIWGGIVNNHFGTDEFIRYSRLLGAEPYLAVNMATGSAEEAANWVEYCNGSDSTYYADLRRKNGHADPYRVKFWGLGNEEEEDNFDPGRLQDVGDFVKEAWMFAKLMKREDNSIQLVLGGDSNAWDARVLNETHAVCDYLSLHYYAGPQIGKPQSLFEGTDALESRIKVLRRLIETANRIKIDDAFFLKWYQFPPRRQPIRLAIDELGLDEPDGIYDWNYALAAGTFCNTILRHADIVGLVTWSGIPIVTDATAAVAQTIFYPRVLFRTHCRDSSVATRVTTPQLHLPGGEDRPILDVSATIDTKDGSLALMVVNRHPSAEVHATLSGLTARKYATLDVHELSASSIEVKNTLDHPEKNVVVEREMTFRGDVKEYTFPARSISALVFTSAAAL